MSQPAENLLSTASRLSRVKTAVLKHFSKLGEVNSHKYEGSDPIAKEIHKLLCYKEARAYTDKLYKSQIKQVIEISGASDDIDEGTTATLATADGYSLILNHQNGSESVSGKKLVSMLRRHHGEVITPELIDKLVKESEQRRAGAKRFDVAIEAN